MRLKRELEPLSYLIARSHKFVCLSDGKLTGLDERISCRILFSKSRHYNWQQGPGLSSRRI